MSTVNAALASLIHQEVLELSPHSRRVKATGALEEHASPLEEVIVQKCVATIASTEDGVHIGEVRQAGPVVKAEDQPGVRQDQP